MRCKSKKNSIRRQQPRYLSACFLLVFSCGGGDYYYDSSKNPNRVNRIPNSEYRQNQYPSQQQPQQYQNPYYPPQQYPQPIPYQVGYGQYQQPYSRQYVNPYNPPSYPAGYDSDYYYKPPIQHNNVETTEAIPNKSSVFYH